MFCTYDMHNVRFVAMRPEEIQTFERCIGVGGVALFPADTVYGLATDPASAEGVRRLYELKGRRQDRPAAVMFFQLELALAALPELPRVTREALERLLPGGITLLLPNRARRFPLASPDRHEVLGLRVPNLTGALAPLAAISWPVLQSSANLTGAPEARRIDQVDTGVRAGVDLILDAGELPGTPSTVVDLTAFDRDGSYAILRDGAVPRKRVEAMLRSSR
jgi:L-threonylcarbamoyladenylate synthase